MKPLPKDFLWGVAASAYQTEGGNVDSNWDRYNATTPGQDPYGKSVDFRHRYREDIALARDLGVNTYRIGINWARVEPRPGQFDEAELAYYDDVVRAIREAGIEPLITLDHFVYPGWIADRGAWTSPGTCDAFVAFSRRMVERYAGDARLWLTFNEAAFFVLIEWKYRKLTWAGVRAMRRHLIRAHREIHALIHARIPGARVSSNIVWCGEGWRSRLLQWFTDWLFLDAAHDTMDWLAFDYYYGGVADAVLQGRTWEADPDPPALGRALRRLARRFPRHPILVAENGMPTLDGQPRADGHTREGVLRACVREVQAAHADGINVVGYLYWSLTDNFEWGHYGPRFGLYTVDVLADPTLARKPTAAVAAYRDIIRSRGVP